MDKWIFCYVFLTVQLYAQDSIKIRNASFEGTPTCCKAPNEWFNCGNVQESPPDIHPYEFKEEFLFGVDTKTYHGKTYLGMVVRDNKTNESISQQLDDSLIAGQCYLVTIYLCRSDTYKSMRSNSYSTELFNYTTPCVLSIWGGDSYCDHKQLLAESSAVQSTEWQKYEFKLHPKTNMNYIELEAYYEPTSISDYNGNILVDNMSAIYKVACD